MEDGFLWYSCCVSLVRSSTNLEVTEERVEQQVDHNEGGKDRVQQTGKDEPRLQLSDEVPALVSHDFLAHLAIRVEQKSHETPSEIPLESLSEDIASE